MGPTEAGSNTATLALVTGYRCDLRCRYCPVGKCDRDMPRDVARQAVQVARASGLARFRLAGGDPLVRPDFLAFLLDEIPTYARLQVTTNGVRLDPSWIARLAEDGRVRLVLSVDGEPETHRANRRGLSEGVDSFSWFETHHKALSAIPGVTVNVVIAPEQAQRLPENIAYLSRRGFFRFNLLPAFYVPWNAAQRDALAHAFRRLLAFMDRAREKGLDFQIVNLEISTPQPLFRSEWVVDVDGEIYDADVMTASVLQPVKHSYSLGNIMDVKDFSGLAARPRPDWNRLLGEQLGAVYEHDTLTVDALLTTFVTRLRAAGFGADR